MSNKKYYNAITGTFETNNSKSSSSKGSNNAKVYNTITGNFETTNNTLQKSDVSTNKNPLKNNGFLDHLAFRATEPLRNLFTTSATVKSKLLPSNTKNKTKTKSNVNVFSAVPTYTISQFDDNSTANKVARVAVEAGKNVINTAKKTGEEIIKNPGESINTIAKSLGYGLENSINATGKGIKNFLDNSPLGRDYKLNVSYNPSSLIHKVTKKYNNYEEKVKNNQKELLEKKYKNDPETLKKALIIYGLDDNTTLQEYVRSNDKKYQQHINGELSEGQQALWNIGENIGNMAPSVALSFINPTIGTSQFATQAYEGYYQEALNRGYSQGEANSYGIIMGGAEVLVERLGFDELGGLKKLSDGNIIKAMGGEALEEFVMPYIDAGVRSIYGEKSNYKDVINDSIESAYYGAVVGGIMNLGGKGLAKVDAIVNKFNSNEKISSSEMQAALEEIKKNNPNYFDDLMNDVPEVIKTELEESSNVETQDKTIKDLVIEKNNNLNVNLNGNEKETSSIQNKISNIESQIQMYENLESKATLNATQQENLNSLRKQLISLQQELQESKQSQSINVKDRNNILPTVEDIVKKETTSNNNINLPAFNNTKSDIELSLKEQQNKIIQNSNPAGDNYHTWIRSENDIKTFEETLNDSDYKEYFESGEDFDETYTAEMAKKALETGKITVYSSYPIEQGTFVSPSKMEAESYSENGKIYSKEVNLTDVAWIDPTQGQYAKINSKILPIVDTTSINNANQVLAPVDISQIRQVPGNIPIDQKLLNKYASAKEIFDNEVDNFDGKVNIKTNIQELNNVDVSSLKSKEAKELAYEIFKKYNSKSIFENNGNKITVSKSGINESVEKIFNNKKQRNLLKEHLQVFSDLGDIIEHATLVNQTRETKNRENINSWNYYFDGLNINGDLYHLEFDVRSLHNGQNQYRVQRLQKKQTTHSGDISNITNDLPAFGQSAFYDNNIPQSNKNVNSNTSSTTKYSMPIEENNTLNNDSSSKIIKSCINEAIEDVGENGRFDADRNMETLYDRIWSYAEKKLGRELTDNDYDTIDEKLEEFYKDGFYVADGSYSLEEYADKVNDNIEKASFILENLGYKAEESHSQMGGLVQSMYFTKGDVTIRVGDHYNGRGGEVLTREQLWDMSPQDIVDFVEKNYKEKKQSKYSLPTKEWNDYLKENFPSAGTKTEMSEIKLPTREDFAGTKTNKTLNPVEIANLTKEDANTTPILPSKTSANKVNDGNSHFAKNIKDKVNMLNAEQKAEILSKEDVRYYDKVTNKESLEKAFKKINDGGSSEALRWANQESKNANATDVAEGWILMKQYADNADYDGMVVVAKKMREIGTQAGQAVQAFNIMERMTPEGMVKYAQSELSEAYDKMVKNKSKEWIDKHRADFDLKPDEVQFIMDTMKEVSKMEDGYDKRVKLAEIQKLMTDKLPPEKGAGIRSWMRISMLFNPKTQVRNVAGNALIMPVNSFSDLFSSYADKIISKKTGVRTTGNTNIKAMLKGMKKGAYEATNDYKKGINTKDMEGNRFEISEGKSFNDKTIIGKNLNRTESLLNYVMDVGDRVFSEASFENSLQNQMVLNKTTEITQEMIDIAHQEALSRTWNDNNDYTRFVLGVRKGLNNLGGNAKIFGYGLGDVLIPFAKTPANLTKAIVDYSPAGLVNTITSGINLKKSLSNGQYTAKMQHEFVQNLGKATAGTMLYVLGFALAKAGITSGDSDDDKDVANFLKNTLGINSYSIKIGDKSFTYDWAQPLAAPLAITANIVQKEKENATLYENIISSLNTAGNILLEQSFLDSLNTVLTNNEGIATGIQEAILELPSRAIPTFSKQIADLVDGTQRTTFEKDKPIETAKNKVVSKIPFFSKTLNPTVDTMGRNIKKYGGKNNIFNVFLNPANINTENISDSAKEIYRLYKSTGETNIMPRVAPYYINQDGEKIILNSNQRAKYQKISGDIIEKNVKKLKNSKEYQNMSDKEKAEVVSGIVNFSYNIAKKDVLNIELSNTYQKAYEYSEIGDIGDYYTFKASIDDTNKDTKKSSITNYLINSNLNNRQLSFLYGSYYSSENVLNSLVNADIPIKEFIKYNSMEFTSDYYANGKEVPNSRKKKVINYVNGLNLSIAQKALLIKMKYSSYKTYDKQISSYVNSKNISFLDKAMILKQAGFTSYDKQIITYVNNMSKTKTEKQEILEDLGFKVRNGKVYSK